MLSNNGICLCTMHSVLLCSFSAGSKFYPVSHFTELHALTLATPSCVLLFVAMTSLIYRSSSSPLLDVYQLLAIVQTEGKTGGGLGTRLV